MNGWVYVAILYVLVMAGTLVGWPVFEALRGPVRRWRLARWSARAHDAVRLESWAATLKKMNQENRHGVLYSGRHHSGRPVTEFVILTYSAGPRHRKLVTS